MNPTQDVLILDDDQVIRNELSKLASKNGYTPILTESPDHALDKLRVKKNFNVTLTLAIIDLDMSLLMHRREDSFTVLQYLSDHFPTCPVVVYSAALMAAHTLIEVNRRHPRALIHDKRTGHDELFQRVKSLLARTVGDLTLTQGTVIHVPTNEIVCYHVVGSELMRMYPAAVYIGSGAKSRAAERFRVRLRQINSLVDIRTHGTQAYSLYILNSSEQATA